MEAVVNFVEGPGGYRRIDHLPVPLPDGTTLGARVWLPEDSESAPVPAILEYVPYRKNDMFAVRDQSRFAYFASHGYAGIRLDIRGSGDSEGIITDEYTAQEQKDAVDAIAWIAAQPWCSGTVGMIGKSWSGFNGLQVAAHQPPALKAVVTAYSTDDRYADDAHYMGGCLLTGQMLGWGTNMHMVATGPPEPRSVGERWKEMWLERLEAFHPQIHTWLSHQRRDDYWKHGSVCEDFSRITCAVYAIGGWCDGYRDAVFRLMEGLACPKKALIGPWSHQYPMDPFEPGPHIGFLQECVRFFDEWLKGIPTGIMDEPPLRIWIQDPVPPATHYPERAGRWAAESSWPSSNVSSRSLFLIDGGLAPEPGEERRLSFRGMQVAGRDAGAWCAFGNPLDAPPDQRAEDGMSLSFTSEPLAEDQVILGHPVARLMLLVDQPLALVAVRLCDVGEDGSSTLITRGLLNLTHLHGHESPQPLEPGKPFEARVRLQSIGQVIPAGHRIRVAISPTYFPWAWPSPAEVTLTVVAGSSFVQLPVRRSSAGDADLAPFGPPEAAPRLPTELLSKSTPEHRHAYDPVTGRLEVLHRSGASRERIGEDLVIEQMHNAGYEITEGDPLSAHYYVERAEGFSHPGWDARLEARNELTSDEDTFFLVSDIRAYDAGECFFERSWRFEIPRDLG